MFDNHLTSCFRIFILLNFEFVQLPNRSNLTKTIISIEFLYYKKDKTKGRNTFSESFPTISVLSNPNSNNLKFTSL